MSFDSTEPSVQNARPRYLYTFTVNGAVTRLCSGDRPKTIGGNTFAASSITHTSIVKSPLGHAKEVFVTMPRTDPIALTLIGGGLAPDSQHVKIEKYHEGDGEIRQIWDGDISGGEVEGALFKVRIPSLLDDLMNTKLPILLAQRECINLVGDEVCEVDLDLAAFRVDTTIVSQVGTVLTVSDVGGKADAWFDLGKLIVGGIRRSIVRHVGTEITIDIAIPGDPSGAAVILYAGCDQQPETCVSKFTNIERYAGAPAMPGTNPMAPNWLGNSDSI